MQTGYIVVETGFLVQRGCELQVGYVVLLAADVQLALLLWGCVCVCGGGEGGGRGAVSGCLCN